MQALGEHRRDAVVNQCGSRGSQRQETNEPTYKAKHLPIDLAHDMTSPGADERPSPCHRAAIETVTTATACRFAVSKA
jgi:hypothetical protein